MATLSWHFPYGTERNPRLLDGTPTGPGVLHILPHDRELVMCESGFHASVRLIDAMRYSQQYLICTLCVSGGKMMYGHDKLVSRRRRVLTVMGGNVVEVGTIVVVNDMVAKAWKGCRNKAWRSWARSWLNGTNHMDAEWAWSAYESIPGTDSLPVRAAKAAFQVVKQDFARFASTAYLFYDRYYDRPYGGSGSDEVNALLESLVASAMVADGLKML